MRAWPKDSISKMSPEIPNSTNTEADEILFYCVKCGIPQTKVQCGFFCINCCDAVDKENTIAAYSIGKSRREKMLSQTPEGTLKTAVWDAWKMTRIFAVMPEESLGYYLRYHEATMSFISDICKTREVTRISKANNDPASVAAFKEALQRRKEAALAGKGTKKPKGPKHDTNGSLIEPEVKAAAMYKCEDPKEKAIMKVIYNLHKTNMLAIAGPMVIEQNPGIDVKGIAKRMNIEL